MNWPDWYIQLPVCCVLVHQHFGEQEKEEEEEEGGGGRRERGRKEWH